MGQKLPKDHSIVAEGGFHEYGTAKTDSKHRILLKEPVSEYYRVYRNDAGQILLEPQVMIPAREAWLYQNKQALESVKKGIAQAKQGKLTRLASFAKHAEDKLD